MRLHAPLSYVLISAQILLALLLGTHVSLAQAPQSLELRGTASVVGTAQNYSLLLDSLSDKDITWITQHVHQFEPANDAVPSLGLSRSAMWIRAELRKTDSQDWYVEIANSSLDSIALYTQTSHGMLTSGVGLKTPFSQRRFHSMHYVVPIDFGGDSLVTVYLRFHGRLLYAPLTFAPALEMSMFTHRIDWMLWVYMGLVTMILAYNLLIYFFIRERDYIWYAGWAAFISCYQFSSRGFICFLLPDGFEWVSTIALSFVGFTALCGVVFIRDFLQTKKNDVFMDRALLALVTPIVIAIFLNLNGIQYWATILGDITIVFGALIGILVGIRAALRGFAPATYYVAAFGSSFISALIYILEIQGFIRYSFFTVNALLFGTSLELILFSVALGSKLFHFRRLRDIAQRDALQVSRENQQLVEKQRQELEQRVRTRTLELEQEQQRSDALLFNILPRQTAIELKRDGRAKATTYGMVTVLFADFKDFTRVSERISPELLVREIDECFSLFDDIIDEHHLEKIKTVGDAYIAAGGLPEPTYTHALDTVHAAMAMIDTMKRRRIQKSERGEVSFELRVGIHTGPVVAGVVGKKKFAYDIWGDTVNLAARMEQSSEAGRIQISESTYQLVEHAILAESRGMIEVKNKAPLQAYFVLRVKE